MTVISDETLNKLASATESKSAIEAADAIKDLLREAGAKTNQQPWAKWINALKWGGYPPPEDQVIE